MKKIVLTGGGTAGHVTPNIALLPSLQKLGYQVEYIGSYTGIEKQLIEDEGISYHGIASGKLRRYFDWQNFTDPFRVVHGYFQARRLLRKLRPDVVFSKGGFVSVPVVRAAKSLHIPVIIHESDMTPGLANKLAFSSASKVCCNFPETVKYLPEGKAVLTGSPIRQELLSGSRQKGARFCGFDPERPVLLIIGGSLGSVAVNTAIRRILPQLLGTDTAAAAADSGSGRQTENAVPRFQVCHLCGKGNLDESLAGTPGYVQFEYIREELPDLFALADVVVSRAGANAICELLALRKPSLLIPLSAAASRGDQILNAKSFARQGFAKVLEEEEITDEKLLGTIRELYTNQDELIRNMEKSEASDAIGTIVGLIEDAAGAAKN